MKAYKVLLIPLLLLLGGTAILFFSKKDKPKVTAALQSEVANVPLTLQGYIPTWLSGTLVRNGPIAVTVNGKSTHNWFDGLAMLHAFSCQEGRVCYSNKFLRTDAYSTVFDDGSLDYTGFATDPCRSGFQYFLTKLIPSTRLALHNANINVAELANEYVALYEIPLPVHFDISTLETLGVFNYEDELPKNKCWESAHPHYADKDVINYLIQYGRTSHYVIYKINGGSKARIPIAEIPVEEPAYMHSFAVTENYIILTEFPFVVKPIDLITKGVAFINNFSWHPERGTQFIVINRHTGEQVGCYRTKPFFAFHHANAFENENNLILDMVIYQDPAIITGGSLDVDADPAAHPFVAPKLERLTLNFEEETIHALPLFDKTVEFPRINDQFDGHPYQYLYLTGYNENESSTSGFALYKVNTVTLDVLTWEEEGCSPGEAVFVPAPNARDEDDGVVLALVMNSIENGSFLLILDGKTFQEIGRAEAPHLIPPGLHGQFFQ